ncbi:MAG TPA: D-alanyl-D-alanine carboxypeptidase/D-alanyl-D-alanine-endopeptidase [Candidatus Kapabacteria bacterium]|nr:D-alanyl-D-alanine carboxypeptidase/D-alanyl-D-alanine-endopeptidase [Candidatus Kapabacteria bacterium]
MITTKLSTLFSRAVFLLMSTVMVLVSSGCDVPRGEGQNRKSATAGSEPYVDTSYFARRITFTGFSGDTSSALNNLREELDLLLSGKELRNVNASVKIAFYNPDNSPHYIYSLNPALSVLPASVEKLFTSSATMWALGSNFSFTTRLDMPKETRVEANRVIGNVLLRPSGDPTFRTNDFDQIASQLKGRGITRIEGDIIGDLTDDDILTPEAKKFFASRQQLVTNKAVAVRDTLAISGLDVSDEGIISSEEVDGQKLDDGAEIEEEEDEEETAPGVQSSSPNFAIDRNVVTVTVTGTAQGAPVSVKVYPPISTIVVKNGGKSSAASVVKTRKVGKGKKRRTVRYRSKSTTTLRVSSTGGDIQTINVSGLLPARVSRTYSFPIKNVPLAMTATLKWKLEQNGIVVTGQPRVAHLNTDPDKLTNLGMKESKLADLLNITNKKSDNYLAESMYRKLSTISAIAANSNDERARKVMRSYLEVCNIDGNQCIFIDGSGLSKQNRTNANTVIDLLTAIRQQPGFFGQFATSLSVAGYDGTLRRRMHGTPAQYNVHGKTGTLNGVTALAGYLITADGQLASFFITMQQFRNGPAVHKRTQDRILALLSNFSYNRYAGENGGQMQPDGSLMIPGDSLIKGGEYAEE